MRAALDDLVLEQKKPILGICVGMQMMVEYSDEGTAEGPGWLAAGVMLFDDARFTGRTQLPHMGRNDIEPAATDGLLRGLGEGARFFLHSHYFAPNDPADLLAAYYVGPFACAVRKGHIQGVQFHPKKSHGWGIPLLKNFTSL